MNEDEPAALAELEDTPIEEIETRGFQTTADLARRVLRLRVRQDTLAEEEKALKDVLFDAMKAIPNLHGLVSVEGAVRIRRQSVYGKIDPAKLREKLADAAEYLKPETVDATKLAKDYPNVAFELGKPKTRESLVVYVKGDPK